ncbi:hypothetical protein A1D24_10540 [Testudinibacter aquarius]|nr:hypothetical protein A1D24_10540 [Testudinibacter aquarius]
MRITTKSVLILNTIRRTMTLFRHYGVKSRSFRITKLHDFCLIYLQKEWQKRVYSSNYKQRSTDPTDPTDPKEIK